MEGSIGIPMTHQETNGPWEFQWGDPIGIPMGLSEKAIGYPMGGEWANMENYTIEVFQSKIVKL